MTVAVDITNHLIPYATVKQMLATAWDEGERKAYEYDSALADWHDHITDSLPEPPTNPYRDK